MARRLRRHINEVFEEERVPWAAYGTFSMLHIFTNPDHVAIKPTEFDPHQQPTAALTGNRQADVVHKLRLAMMVGRCRFQRQPRRPRFRHPRRGGTRRHDRRIAQGRPHAEARGRDLSRTTARLSQTATSELLQILRLTGGGRYRWRRWVPTFVGMTARRRDERFVWLELGSRLGLAPTL